MSKYSYVAVRALQPLDGRVGHGRAADDFAAGLTESLQRGLLGKDSGIQAHVPLDPHWVLGELWVPLQVVLEADTYQAASTAGKAAMDTCAEELSRTYPGRGLFHGALIGGDYWEVSTLGSEEPPVMWTGFVRTAFDMAPQGWEDRFLDNFNASGDRRASLERDPEADAAQLQLDAAEGELLKVTILQDSQPDPLETAARMTYRVTTAAADVPGLGLSVSYLQPGRGGHALRDFGGLDHKGSVDALSSSPLPSERPGDRGAEHRSR